MNWGLVLYVALLSGVSGFGGLAFTAYIATSAMRQETNFRKLFKQMGIVWAASMALITMIIYFNVPAHLSATPDRQLGTLICSIGFAFAVTVFYFSGSKKAVVGIAALVMAIIAPRIIS